MHRREFLQTGAAATALAAWPYRSARAHNSAGPVTPPAPVPAVQCRMHDGRALALRTALQGKTTALQLMFTGCSATCPIQGALFADLQQRLAARPGPASQYQLLSVSIDPLADDPRALTGWLRRFDAGPGWLAASPEMRDLDPWLDFLQSRQSGPDRHTAQVYLFDRRARLSLRSPDFPPATEVLRLLDSLSAQPV